jgi:hypothetical protein
MSTLHLPFRDHMHYLNAGQKDPGTAKSLEPQHGPRASLDRPMVLLDHVVEIFALADLDGCFAISIDRFEPGEIGTAFVDGHCFGHAILGDRFLKVTPRCSLVPMGPKQKVNGVAVLVDGPVEISPFALDADVGLVHPPALTNHLLAQAERFLQYRQQLDGPAVHGRMIDRNAALGHHLFKMAQAQRIRHVPPHAEQDDVERVVQALEHLCDSWIQVLFHRSKRLPLRCQHSSSPYRDKTLSAG